MKELKQWELPNNSKVKLPDGSFVEFLKMDGMYARWLKDGETKIGNYNSFIKKDDHYEVVNN